jgi:hypothetical protein
MRDDTTRRHHDGFLDGAVLWRRDNLLIAGRTRLWRCVTIIASGGRGCRDNGSDDGGREECGNDARHDDTYLA